MDEKLQGPLGVFNYELEPDGGRLKKRQLELVEVRGTTAETPQIEKPLLDVEAELHDVAV